MNLLKSRGIVIHHIPYSETSVIAKILTEDFGLESFIIKGVRKKGSKVKNSVLQHLSIVDIVFYLNKKGSLHNLKEIKLAYQFYSIPFDIIKSSIALFINEILYKSIRESNPDRDLFDFIRNSIISLDEASDKFSDFHIHFILCLTKYLGFFPNNNFSETNYIFNIREGSFKNSSDDILNCPDKLLSFQLNSILNGKFREYYIPRVFRKDLLNILIDYYKIHVSGFKGVKSLKILETIFN